MGNSARLALCGGADEARGEKATKLLVAMCIIFALSSSLSKIGIFDLLNKAIIGFLCLLILVIFCQERQSRYVFLVLSVTAVLHVIALSFPISPKEGIATYFMYAFWVLFWIYILNNRYILLKTLFKLQKSLNTVLMVWTLFTAFSFLIPSCYKLGWGGERYFTSFTTDSFEIAPVALFMLALDILLFKFDGNKRKALGFSAIPLACVFAAGTRTYLVVVVIEFAILLKMMIERRGTFLLMLTLLVTAVVGIASVTNIGQKFASAMFETDDAAVFFEVLTNGRSEFWAIDLNAFFDSDWFTMLFGHGFSFVYELNQEHIGMRLYAHNDFINILLNFGIAGMIIYFAAFLPLAGRIKNECGLGMGLLFVAMWLFNAFFNMIYVYVVAVIGMGFLALALLLPEKTVPSLDEGEIQ
ncbi:MAG: O-antigen ligase family protein [Coriobacteriia bacterium]|nr:O-antigen ligase family protein [Coriobacteriia bacterium]